MRVEKRSLQTNMNKENTCTYYHTRLPIEHRTSFPRSVSVPGALRINKFPHGYNIKTKRTFKALMTRCIPRDDGTFGCAYASFF